MSEVIFAGGSRGPNVRADGNRGFMKRGYYIRDGASIIGPFDTEAQAGLVDTIMNAGPRRLHESELVAGELHALRSLRRKGVVAPVGLYLNRPAPAPSGPQPTKR